jgi:hypothetical protein
LKYDDIKHILQRRLQRRQGVVTEEEIEECVAEYKAELTCHHDIPRQVLEEESERLNAYLTKRIVPTLGHVPMTRPDGVNQLLCANVNGLA